MPADCSSSSTSMATSMATTVGNVSTPVQPLLAQTTPQTLFTTTTSAAPTGCVSLLATILTER